LCACGRGLQVGHTIQRAGINDACDGRVLRVDVGLSEGCGNGAPEVLEIYQDSRVGRGGGVGWGGVGWGALGCRVRARGALGWWVQGAVRGREGGKVRFGVASGW
jgi:hypothetical protein